MCAVSLLCATGSKLQRFMDVLDGTSEPLIGLYKNYYYLSFIPDFIFHALGKCLDWIGQSRVYQVSNATTRGELCMRKRKKEKQLKYSEYVLINI